MAYGVIRTIRNAGFLLFASVGLASANPVTVAAFGDSLTQGFGLVAEQGFVPQLQGWLNDAGAEVSVINAGVSGDTTAGGLSRIEWTLTPEVDAIIVALGGNDLLRGVNPASSRSNLEGILQIATEQGLDVLLVGMEAPSNFGADFKAAFDAMYPELSEAYGTLYHPNFLRALSEQSDRAETLRLYMQGDGIHPNADGVALIVDDLGPSVLELVERAASK